MRKSRFLVLSRLDFSLLTSIQKDKMSVTQPRQNFHADSEAGINRQINLELYASYTYMSMAMFYDRDDVALDGFKKYFKTKSNEKRCHAEKLMTYQNKRGGRIVLQAIQKPDKDEWGSGLEGMQEALALEKNVNQSVIELCKLASSHDDEQMCDFIEDHFLAYHVEKIKQMSDFVSQLKLVGPGLGEYHFNKQLLED